MDAARSLFLLTCFTAAGYVLGDTCSYEKCNEWRKDKKAINVHLICHTHDDLGWIKTVDQYYYGSKKALVTVGVQYILNTVIDELQKDPSRRFSWAETGFLWRWLNSHHDFERHHLAKLFQTGQMEITGGGWVQNDEATAHYVDIIDQMAFGLRKLNETLGRCGIPKVAWQIDPFGHSREMANLFAMMDFEALFFARLHYLEKAERLKNNSLEFIWDASDDLKTNILTGAFYEDNYGPPKGFCFDTLCGDDPIMDNEDLEGYNVDEKLRAFFAHVKEQASHQKTNHVMLLMGSDFHYTSANHWYSNLDKLINYVNEQEKETNIRVFYSTPSCYVKAINEAQPRLPLKSDDFFPYASSNHSYWTGYFTSRPTFKGFIRQSSAFLQLVKQLDAFADLDPSDEADLNVFRRAVALVQHHDAVTGTAKENVTKDYEKRLAKGWTEGAKVINDAMAKLAPKNKSTAKVPQQVMCPLINETVCEFTEKNGQLTVTAFNGNSHPMKTVIRIPYYSRTAAVWGSTGEPLDFQIRKSFYTQQIASDSQAPYELLIPVEIPALGFETFFVSGKTKSPVNRWSKYSAMSTRSSDSIEKGNASTTVLTNGLIELTFDESGRLSAYKDIETGKTIALKQEFSFYKGLGFSQGSNQSSGAYVFRPNGTQAVPIFTNITLQTVQGNLVNETRQTISPWISQVIRLIRGKKYVEFEWTIGPIPKESENPITKEVVTRYTTDIKSDGRFYTDSNGRQIMERRRNFSPSFQYVDTEPVAGNYYPVSSRIFIKDSNTQMTILNDRSQGGSSLKDGEIELMLHRRTFYDDHWGVEEALDEPGVTGAGLVARGRHWLLIDTPIASSKLHRSLAFELFNSPILTFSNLKGSIEQYRTEFITQYSGLANTLPESVNILTLEQWTGRTLLLRLEHIYQNEEDVSLSNPVTVNLKGLFTSFEITAVEELTLGANKRKLKRRPYDDISFSNQSRRFHDEFTVQLQPMEIRTFRVEVAVRRA